jgi:hypothetical protein
VPEPGAPEAALGQRTAQETLSGDALPAVPSLAALFFMPSPATGKTRRLFGKWEREERKEKHLDGERQIRYSRDMDMNTINGLKIWSSGYSRSRIVIIKDRKGPPPPPPVRISGLRWIAIGESAASKLRQITEHTSWPELAKTIPGGITSSTWQKIRHNYGIEKATTTNLQNYPITLHNFGHGNSRILLIEESDSVVISPIRFGSTSIIALGSYAYAQFSRYIRSISGGTNQMADTLAESIPGGIGGSAIVELRQITRQHAVSETIFN